MTQKTRTDFSPNPRLSRRGVLRSSLGAASGLGLAAAGAQVPPGLTTPQLALAAAQSATPAAGPPQPFAAAGLNVEEQGLYHLPRDHQWHGGPTYFTNDFNEWHYYTFLGEDKTTGHQIGIFWLGMWQGWVTDLNRPAVLSVFAYHDKVTGAFYPTTLFHAGEFESSGSDAPDYDFDYAVTDPDGKEIAITYTHAQEQWIFKSAATDQSKIVNKVGRPYAIDVTGVVEAPGYVPVAYWGLESIGFNPLYNQNPETMYGLSYYYAAPQMTMTGSVTLADGVHEVEGVAWFEHQWGNFKNTEWLRYFWGYARFDNGDAFTWRQYYGNPAGQLLAADPFDIEAANEGWTAPHPEVSRFSFIPKGGGPQHAFGRDFLFTPLKWWTSPETGVNYPWWGEMQTPKGTYYLSPTFPSQESVSLVGPFIEGALLLRAYSIDGPVVAEGYCELFQAPAWGPTGLRGLPEQMEALQLNVE